MYLHFQFSVILLKQMLVVADDVFLFVACSLSERG